MPSAFPASIFLAPKPAMNAWLAAGCHGEMDYMAAYASPEGNKRALPAPRWPKAPAQ
jgi:epoxyqueuosine reductase QueG